MYLYTFRVYEIEIMNQSERVAIKGITVKCMDIFQNQSRDLELPKILSTMQFF